MSALLEVSHLNAFYGASHVLQDISLAVEKGKIICLLGRNGMGKSTTLKSIMGLVRPKAGTIHFKGQQIAGMPPHQISRLGVGYVPEERAMFPTLSVLDNLLMGKKRGRADKAGKLDTWSLERIYGHFPILKDRCAAKAAFLSGGEQQMLTLARTLMGNPELLLVDEPTEGLAPLMVKEIRDVLAEINKAGVTVLLVEHNLKVALSLADHIYLMGKAHIGFGGTRQDLEAQPDIKKKYLEV